MCLQHHDLVLSQTDSVESNPLIIFSAGVQMWSHRHCRNLAQVGASTVLINFLDHNPHVTAGFWGFGRCLQLSYYDSVIHAQANQSCESGVEA